MLTFKEYHDLKEANMMGIVQQLARKYALPATTIVAVLSGQGCRDSNQCPTPAVQQQIKQDVQTQTPTQQPHGFNNMMKRIDQKKAAERAAKGLPPEIDSSSTTSPNAGNFIP